MSAASRAYVTNGHDYFVRNALGVVVVKDADSPVARLRRFDQPNSPQACTEPLAEGQFGLRPSYEEQAATTLVLSVDDARAIYEALGEHFGHAGASAAALRKDYDAERRRVDTLTAAVLNELAAGPRRPS